MLNIAALISGGGRTVLNFAENINNGALDADIRIVIASRSGIKGIERAADIGLPVVVVPRRSFPDTQQFSNAVWREINNAGLTPENCVVALAGFLSLLNIPDDFLGRVINIHPALLPRFGGRGMYGDRVHRAVIDAGETESGCTVHFADNEYDHGPIIAQKRCPVLPGDTPDDLAARVFDLECELYPSVLQAFAEDRIRLADGKAVIQGTI
ncbi:MAG TPA: phosphoribosylglycinamide formyltransferase [Phycisphaeraceae bacterium]|nr:phosphoribosylglycinamide formyltransferase [Phycisphaeraceae bacterium]